MPVTCSVTGYYVIESFKDKSLEAYYFDDGSFPRTVPTNLSSALRRKLDIIHAAHSEADLRVPPGNQFERLLGNLEGWNSIRVNRQYRLIFRWDSGKATELYLDPHSYR